MIIIKCISLIIILFLSSYIGIIITNKYKSRVMELKEIKKALNIFETKIKFTYAPLPEIFKEISKNLNKNIANIFEDASCYMKEKTAQSAWIEAINNSKTSMNKEDLEIIKDLGKLLGKTDIDGQVSQIKLTDKFIDEQIETAEYECRKNAKMYKALRYSFWSCNSNNSYIGKENMKYFK